MRAKQSSCFHCGTEAEIPFSVKVASKEKTFCCNGCVCACLVIHDAGAASYYKKRKSYPVSLKDVKLALLEPLLPVHDPVPAEKPVEIFDAAGVPEEGKKTVSLQIDRIHCDSSLLLIETVLRKIGGIDSARMNPDSNKAEIVFSPEKIRVSEIVHIIEAIGYRANLPAYCRRVTSADTEELIYIYQIRRGDRIHVLCGERIPANGTLLRDSCEVDESILSGGSRQMKVEAGDPLKAGALVVAGVALFRVDDPRIIG